jgi:hypothetical protein
MTDIDTDKYINLKIDVSLIGNDTLCDNILDDIKKVLDRYDFKEVARVTDENDTVRNKSVEFHSDL